MRSTYDIQAGRVILRDGTPFVAIQRVTDPETGEGPPPVDVDEFARFCARAPQQLAELRELHDRLVLMAERSVEALRHVQPHVENVFDFETHLIRDLDETLDRCKPGE